MDKTPEGKKLVPDRTFRRSSRSRRPPERYREDYILPDALTPSTGRGTRSGKNEPNRLSSRKRSISSSAKHNNEKSPKFVKNDEYQSPAKTDITTPGGDDQSMMGGAHCLDVDHQVDDCGLPSSPCSLEGLGRSTDDCT